MNRRTWLTGLVIAATGFSIAGCSASLRGSGGTAMPDTAAASMPAAEPALPAATGLIALLDRAARNVPTADISMIAKGAGYSIHIVRTRDQPLASWADAQGRPLAVITYTDDATGEIRVLDQAADANDIVLYTPLAVPEYAKNRTVPITTYCHYLSAVADDRYVYVLERADMIAPVEDGLRVEYHRLATQLVLAAVSIAKGGKVREIEIKENVKAVEKGTFGVPEVVQMEGIGPLTLEGGVISFSGRQFTFDGTDFHAK